MILADLAGHMFATVPEAAAILRSDPRSIRRAIAVGQIPATKIGPRAMVPMSWLREQASASAPETDQAGIAPPKPACNPPSAPPLRGTESMFRIADACQ
jgi:hypothetical protein